MKHLTKSDEEDYELNNLAHDLAYQSVKYSELWKLLPSNEDCDKTADELMVEIREFVRGRIEKRVEKIEQENEARSAERAEAA